MTDGEMRELIREAAYMRGIELSDGSDDLYGFDLRLYKALESFCKQDSEAKDKKEMQKGCRKPVDLSVLIDSGIDMEYRRGQLVDYGPMTEIQSGEEYPYVKADLQTYPYAKPRMNYWFSNANDYWGGVGIDFAVARLVDAGFDVDVNKQAYAFRIHGLRDGYRWPWESE